VHCRCLLVPHGPTKYTLKKVFIDCNVSISKKRFNLKAQADLAASSALATSGGSFGNFLNSFIQLLLNVLEIGIVTYFK
jgi:hypothetical protein